MAKFDYEQSLFAYLDNLKHQLNFKPLSLGGVSGEFGGSGGPPGGFIGKLPQTKVAYDSVEAEVYTTTSTGVTTSGTTPARIVNSTRYLYPTYFNYTTGGLKLYAYNDTNPNYWEMQYPGGLPVAVGNALGQELYGKPSPFMYTMPNAGIGVSVIESGVWSFDTYWLAHSNLWHSPAIPWIHDGYWDALPDNWIADIYGSVQVRYEGGGGYELFQLSEPIHIHGGVSGRDVYQNVYIEETHDQFILNPTDKLVLQLDVETIWNGLGAGLTNQVIEMWYGGTKETDPVFKVTLPSKIAADSPAVPTNPNGVPLYEYLTGESLVDNLNHIRGRIARQESNMSQVIFTFEGTADIGPSPIRIYNFVKDRLIKSVGLSCSVPPSGTALIADVHMDGYTVFVNQDDRPVLASGNYYDYSDVAENNIWYKNSYLTAEIDQVGSIVAGEYPVVYVIYR